MKIRLSIATIASLVAFGLSSSAQAAHDWSACKAEVEKFKCTSKNDKEVYECLQKHDKDLSKTCDASHEKYEKANNIKK